MSIASAIAIKQQQVADSYTAVSNKGGTLPATQNLTNLATAISSIPSGGSAPVITSLFVTPTTSAQTITAPSGTDGYSPVNVAAVTASIDANIQAGNIKKDVQILGITGTYEGSGGGGIGIPREVKNSVYQMPTENFTFSLPSDVTDMGSYGLAYAFYNCTTLTSIDFKALTTVTGSGSFNYAFSGCTGLTDVYFRALTTSSFGSSYKNQFNYMMQNTGTSRTHTLHFPSNMQSKISGLTGYPLFGGTSGYVTLSFDLTATS